MAALAARKTQRRVWSVQHFRGIDSPLAPSVPPSPLLRWNGSKRGVVGHSGTPHSPYHARVTSEMGGAQTAQTWRGGRQTLPLKKQCLNLGLRGRPALDHRDGEAQQWPVAAQSGNAGHGYWEPRLVRRRQFANKSCQAEEVSCSCTRAARS